MTTKQHEPTEYELPTREHVSRCRACGAGIAWILTRDCRAMPLSLSAIRVDAQGRRWAPSHRDGCPAGGPD